MPPSVEVICQKHPYLGECLDIRKLDREWRQHVFESEAKPEMSWGKYWQVVRRTKVSKPNEVYFHLRVIPFFKRSRRKNIE